jgi:hypothetical protein
VIVWLAVALWVVIVVWSLALMRVASTNERGRRRRPATQPATPRIAPVLGRHRERNLVIVEVLILVGSVAAMVLLSTEDQWDQYDLVGLLAVLVVGSDFLTLRAKRFRISGSFLGLVLAMALLGPAPAGVMGIAAASVDAIRGRTRGSYLLSNLATYAFFPLVGALALDGLADLGMADEGGVALAVFAVFVGANVLNFAMIAGHTVYLRGGSLPEMFRTVYMPVFPWELATASLTAMAVYGFEVYGAGVIGLFALALAVCQLLLRSLLQGQEHGEEVLRRSDQLDVRHEGMVGLLLETLALRDPSAARPGWASTSRRSRTPRGCCTTSARRRCPTISCWVAASCTRPSGGWSSAIRPTARACCCASRASARSRTRCSRTTSGSTATATPTASPARTSRSLQGSLQSPRCTTSSRRPTPTRSR